jgi:hypothetical protein
MSNHNDDFKEIMEMHEEFKYINDNIKNGFDNIKILESKTNNEIYNNNSCCNHNDDFKEVKKMHEEFKYINDNIVNGFDYIKNLESKTNHETYNNNLYCECNFDSQIAYIVKKLNDIPTETITIINYLENKNLQAKVDKKELFLVCEKGNELIKYQSDIKKSHFKHKNGGDNSMSKWHKKWQEYFDDTEIPIGNRRADAVVGNRILEFQYSRITTINIDDRTSNYKNYEVFWIIDCRDVIEIENTNDTYIIKFLNDHWKYKNFINQPYIYLENGNRIFRIKPTDVKSNMIEVANYKVTNEFIDYLKNDTIIWEDNPIEQGVIYHNQRGAGCGKTYESIQLLQGDKFTHKEIFIYLTKIHSAKDVIYDELKEQRDRGALDKLDFFDEDGYYNDILGKQYKITFSIKGEHNGKQIIIGTIDSFTYAIGSRKHNYSNFFSGIVKSIRDGYVSVTKDGRIKYAQRDVNLNKKCIVVIDEAQDLGPEYIEAFDMIVNKTGIDVYVIGDELQSIWGDNNIYTYVKNNKLKTKIVFSNGKNQVKRFHNTQFKNFVNKIIDFEKYNLPPIEGICDDAKCKYKHDNENKPYHIFEIPEIYSNDSDDIKVNTTVEKIIEYVNNEINENNYLPNNFMFIFSFINKNYLATQLEARLQDFWVKKFDDKNYQKNVLSKDLYWKDKININKFRKYVYLHKSEDGQPINLRESDKATRMLSIHSSKGNGCEVVFSLGISEYTLSRFSKQKCNIVYDSLLHVAITRQKKSLYIGLVKNGDEIWNRFNNNFEIDKDIKIRPRIENITKVTRVTDIVEYLLKNDDIFKKINATIIIPNNCNKKILYDDDHNNIVDWGHHVIRYCVFFYNIMKNIVEKESMEENNEQKTQFFTILGKVSKLQIVSYFYKEYYKKLEKINDMHKKGKDIDNIPILLFETSEKTIYKKYCNILKDFMLDIQNKLNKNLKNNKLPSLCPLETVILLHMIDVMDNGRYNEYSVMEVYTIMYCYDECSKELNNHSNDCLCKKKFIEGNNNNNENSYIAIRKSIKNHYEKLEQINASYNNYHDYIVKNYKDTNFIYNIKQPVSFNGNTMNFRLLNCYPILAYSDKCVIHFIIKPQFNKINFNETMIDIILNNFILCKCDDDKKRYQNKKIIACILTLKSHYPIFYELDINKFYNDIILYIKDFLVEKYNNYHLLLYEFYEYCRVNKPNEKNSVEYTHEKLYDALGLRLPIYMLNYFDVVNKEAKQSGQDAKNIVYDKVGNKKHFLEKIENNLIYAIDEYFGIGNDNKINNDY